MNKLLKYLSYIIMFCGALIILYVRIDGIDLTEGQIILEYFPLLILGIGCLFGGYAIFNNTIEKLS